MTIVAAVSFPIEGVPESGVNGEFTIPEFPSSLSIVSASHPDYAPGWTQVRSLSSPLRITLTPGGTLEGVVTFGGIPLENRRSHVNIEAGETQIMLTYTGDGGAYSIGKVPTEPVTMRVGFHEGGLRRSIMRDVVPENGQSLRQDFDFSDTYNSYVEGVLLLDDRPVPLSLLRAIVHFDNGDTVYYQTSTRDDGSYTLGPVPASTFEFGATWLLLEDGSYLTPSYETVTTRPEETTKLDLKFSSP